MHIVHVTPYYAPAYAFGGVPRAVEGMAAAAAKRGHTVTVLTTDALSPNQRLDLKKETHNGVQVMRSRNLSQWLRGAANLSTPMGMYSEAKRIIPSADVVHCHEFRTTENLVVSPIAQRHRVPLILSPHGTLPHGTGRATLKSAWDAVISPAMARCFEAVVGLTEQESNEAQALWQRISAHSRHVIIPNGIDLAEFDTLPDGAAFRQRFGLGDAAIILFMGRLHPRKGVDLLARSMRKLQTSDVKLVIAGPDDGLGYLLNQLAAKDDRIVLTGYLDGEERLAALAAADVFALPAVGEGLPMAVLEAMAAAVPVIVSPGCNLPEVAANNAGIEAPVDEATIAVAIDALLSDAQTRSQMGHAARHLIEDCFTWNSVAEQLEALYESLR